MMTEELLSQWPLVQNWIFVIFLICFTVNVYILGNRKNIIPTLAYSLSHRKSRDSIFTESTNNELGSKIILSGQTLLLLSLIFYRYYLSHTDLSSTTVNNMFTFLSYTVVVLLLFTLVKFLLNSFFGFIFFEKENVQLWNETFFSFLSLSSLLLFIPTLASFFIEKAYTFCYYFILFYFIYFTFLTFYKIYEIFFLGKRSLLYFILYLCGFEIIPLFLAYKVYFYYSSLL